MPCVSVIEPLINKNRQPLENMVNEAYRNSGKSEVPLTITIDKKGRFKAARISLQKTHDFTGELV